MLPSLRSCTHIVSISDPNTSASFTMGIKKFLEVRFPTGYAHAGPDAWMPAMDLPDSWKTIS